MFRFKHNFYYDFACSIKVLGSFGSKIIAKETVSTMPSGKNYWLHISQGLTMKTYYTRRWQNAKVRYVTSLSSCQKTLDVPLPKLGPIPLAHCKDLKSPRTVLTMKANVIHLLLLHLIKLQSCQTRFGSSSPSWTLCDIVKSSLQTGWKLHRYRRHDLRPDIVPQHCPVLGTVASAWPIETTS